MEFAPVVLALALAGCGNAPPSGVPATATLTASPTPAATATPAPVFSDPLTADTHQRSVIPSHCQFANGGYQASAGLCTLKNHEFDDGEIVVDVTATAGSPDTAFSGLIWRATTGGMYEFGALPSGGWLFAKSVGTSISVVDSGPNSAISQGLNVKNTLAVSFRGSQFVFIVNGAQVGQDNDNSLTGLGVIGVTAGPDCTAVINNFAYCA